MDISAIYSFIRSLAKELSDKESKYLRADLAYDLQKFGIEQDSFYVSELVWGAYKYYQDDIYIGSVYLSNDSQQSIVSQYKSHSLLVKENKSELLTEFDVKIKSIFGLLGDLADQIFDSEDILISKTNIQTKDFLENFIADFPHIIIGNKGVLDVQDEARIYFEYYQELINLYTDSKCELRVLIEDFVALRGEVNRIFTEYSSKLVDIFGDSIKVVDPSLFDFNQIEWLDVDSIFKRIELEYTKLSDSCSILLTGIQKSFIESLSESVSSYNENKSNSTAVGLAFAGLNMLGHYIDSQDKINLIKQELVSFKGLMNRDISTIKGDHGRLLVILKRINELYIPKAHVFFKNAKTVLNEQMTRVTSTIYEHPEVKTLNEQRNKILSDIQSIESTIVDAQLNLDFYQNHIGECNLLLDSHQKNYDTARSAKPIKPNILLNIITLGYSRKVYSRDMYSWNAQYGSVIRTFEQLSKEVSLDETQVNDLMSLLVLNKKQIKSCKAELIKLNKEIQNKIILDDSKRLELLSELKSILLCLSIAKDILNAKLDSKLLEAVKIQEIEASELPAGMNALLNDFISAFASNLTAAHDSTRDFFADISDTKTNPYTDTADLDSFSNESVEKFTALQNSVLTKALSAINSWSMLEQMREQNQLEKEAYDAKLTIIQQDFNSEIQDINHASDMLAQVIKEINTAKDYESMKNALLSLAETESSINSDQDLLRLLKGELKIEI